MTPDSTTTEMERRVARAMFADTNDCSEDRFELAEQITQDCYLSNARAALKAHAEWLEEQELVVVKRNTIEPFCRGQGPALRGYINKATDWLEPLNITVTKGQFHNLWKAAQQEDQHHD